MSKNFNLKTKSAMAEMLLHAAEEKKMGTPIEEAYKRSKEVKENNTIGIRRDGTLVGLKQLSDFMDGFISYKNLYDKVGKPFDKQMGALKSISSILQIYLSSYNKRYSDDKITKAPTMPKVIYLLKEFKRLEIESDSFANSDYQPLIFLQQLAGSFSDIAMSISMELRGRDQVTRKLFKLANSYFPRSTMLSQRNFANDKERKIAWVEKQAAEVARIKMEEENKNEKKEQ